MFAKCTGFSTIKTLHYSFLKKLETEMIVSLKNHVYLQINSKSYHYE